MNNTKRLITFLSHGFNGELANKAVDKNYSFSKLKRSSKMDLKDNFEEEDVKIIIELTKRKPIPTEIIERLIQECDWKCCVCWDIKKYEPIIIHHIEEHSKTRDDSYENLVVLCLNHHAEAHSSWVISRHPLPKELIVQKKLDFIKAIKEHKEGKRPAPGKESSQSKKDIQVELTFNEGEADKTFRPIYIEEETIFEDKNLLKESFSQFLLDRSKTFSGNLLLDIYNAFKNPSNKESLEEFNLNDSLFDAYMAKIKTFDDYVDFLNQDFSNKINWYDPIKKNEPQPVVFSFDPIMGPLTKLNLSVCTIKLKLNNNGPDILEDYKVYLNFENVLMADSVDKRTELHDTQLYQYNIIFNDVLKAEFNPSNPILVQNDSIEFDQICFNTCAGTSKAFIDWRIVSRNFSSTGKLEMKFEPIIEQKERSRYVDNPEDFEPFKKIKYKTE